MVNATMVNVTRIFGINFRLERDRGLFTKAKTRAFTVEFKLHYGTFLNLSRSFNGDRCRIWI